VEKEQVVQHVITNLCMGLQADQLHGMVVSSPTVQLPELTVSIDDQSSRELNNNNSENNFTLIDRFLDTISKPMEAIKMLIEQEAKKQKTSAIQKKAAVAPAMEA